MIDLGDLVPLTIETRDAAGNLANAGAVVLTIGLPDGTTVTPAFSNPSTGRYQFDYQTVQPGHHTVNWAASGLNASAYTDSFDVSAAVPAYIVSLARAKRKLKIPETSTEHDEDIRDYIEAATEVVEDHVKQKVSRRTVVDEFDIRSAARTVVLNHTPAISLTTVQRIDTAFSWNVADLHLNGEAGVVTVELGPLLRGHVRFTYAVGMPVIPAKYRRAALIIIEHLWQTERAQSEAGPFPGAYEDTAEGMRFRGGQGYAIPNRALELLGKPAPMVG